MTPPRWYFLIIATPREDVAPAMVGTNSCPTFCRTLSCRTSAGTREAGVGRGAAAPGPLARPAGGVAERRASDFELDPSHAAEATISPNALMMATAFVPCIAGRTRTTLTSALGTGNRRRPFARSAGPPAGPPVPGTAETTGLRGR